MKINTSAEKIKEALARGVEKIYPSAKSLEEEISRRKIRIYCGYDPSSPSLHVGHLVTLKKLSQFQSLGHEVIMLIGDFTGMIGDPTDKLATRRKMTRKEVLHNAKNYKKIASKVLNFSGGNPAKILYNSGWSDNLSFINLIEIASNFTVQQMMARDMFQERAKNNKPIHLHEFLYPLAQAYDSVAMDIDMEIGGKDQTFNMLCGRDLIKIIKNKEKFIITTKLLVDPSGKKMGKTEGNAVSLDGKPGDIYGKIMSWPDEFILPGLELCTSMPMDDIDNISKGVKEGKVNPRDAKARLAREIVATFYDSKAALAAEGEFKRVFKEKKDPADIPGIKLSEKKMNILDLLVSLKLASSRSEAKRLVLQKGIKIDNREQREWNKVIEIRKGAIVQAGKRRFAKIV